MSVKVREEYLEILKERIDYALSDCQGAPNEIVIPMLLNVLDTAQKEFHLNGLERMAACKYITEMYGYNF